MVTMFRGAGWKIAIYGGEHGVPHFHIEGPSYRCSVSIETHQVIVGTPEFSERLGVGLARIGRS